MGYNLSSRSQYIHYISEKKWEYRLEGKIYSPKYDSNSEMAKLPLKPNKCKYFSKDMIKYINLQTALCPKCKELGINQRCTKDHLELTHHVQIESVDTIYNHLKNNSAKKILNEKNQIISKHKDREEMIQIFKEILDPNSKKIKQFFTQL